MEADCLYSIKDEELLKRLAQIGCTANTYDGVVNWFREERDVIITVYPLFGKKIDYDQYAVKGYFYEINPTANGGVYLQYDSYDKYFESYKYYEEETDEYIELLRNREFDTYADALRGSVVEAVKNYYWYSNNKYLDIAKNHPNEERTEYPEYLALCSFRGFFHTAFVFDHYDNEIEINCPVYRLWEVDTVHDYGKIEVQWDGAEFIVRDCKNKEIIGKKLWQIRKSCLGHIEYDLLPEEEKTGNEKYREIAAKYKDSDD